MVKKLLILLFISLALLVYFAYSELTSFKVDKQIILGSSLPLSGINQELGQEVIQGANTYFSHINARGGIRGKNIHLIYYDDKYEPQNTLKNIDTLINKHKAFALFGFVGTPTVKKILPIVKENSIPFIAPYTGASFLRNSRVTSIINFRASYQQEIDALVDYLHNEKGIEKFAIFYQNDDYGEEGYIAAVEALGKRELRLVSEGTYKRNTLSIRHALNEIQSARPEAIIIAGAYKPSAHFIKKARECCFTDTIFAPISFVNSNALVDELDGKAENIIFSQTVPSYHDTSLPVAREYLDLLRFYYPKKKPTYASFESFLAAKSLVIALKKTKEPITRENFLEELKNLPNDALESIPIDYHHKQLLNTVYLSVYESGKFHLIQKAEN